MASKRGEALKIKNEASKKGETDNSLKGSLRGVKPLSPKTSSSPSKERGTKGER
jgi:hypothetical protein